MNVANKNIRERGLTTYRVPFEGSNLFARRSGDHYTVYSYGTHWPLFIHDEATGQWFANKEKRSVTTSRHYNQAHPGGDVTLLTCEEMRQLDKRGLLRFMQGKFKGR